MTEESLMILGLLQDGKISASEAERLLRTVRETGQPPAPAAKAPSSSPTLGQAAQSAAKFAGRAIDFLPKPKIDSSKIGDKVGEAAGDMFRAAKSAVQDVATEVGKLSQQTKQALHFDSATTFGSSNGRPTRGASEAEAAETAHSDVHCEDAHRLLLVNVYGNIHVVGQEDLQGSAQVTLIKNAWAQTESAARLLLQQAFLVTRVENGVCRVEVIAPSDSADRMTIDYEINVPRDLPLEIQTGFGSVDAASASPAVVARSQSGRVSIRRPYAGGIGEARLSSATGDIVVDGWNVADGSLRIETQSGDVEAQETHCGRDLTLTSRSGDILVTDSSAGRSARVETQSGGARLTRLHSPALEVETTTGSAILREASGTLTMKTASGSLDATGLNTPAVSLNTVSGNVRLAFAAPFSGSVAGTSVSGDLTLALWDNSDTRVEMNTATGSLTCLLPLTEQSEEGGRRLSGKLGDGMGSIRLQSVSGDLRVEKEVPPKRTTRSRGSV